jgi:hypothetical protein
MWTDKASKSIADIKSPRNVLAADFDNDGIDELLFTSQSGPNQLMALRDGNWVDFGMGMADEPRMSATSAVVLDVDGDGQLELVVAHGDSSPQPMSMYRMGQNENHWLRVVPLTPNGAPARGARVSLQQRRRAQLKVIDSGSGYAAQQEPVAHFGLGPTTDILQVSIQWPDGAAQVIAGDDIMPDTVLRVPHPSKNSEDQ